MIGKRCKQFLATAFFQGVVWYYSCFAMAASVDTAKGGFVSSAQGSTINWPWRTFFNSLISELTGPVPLALGIFGIVGAAIALFSGNGGDGMKKFITLIFAISICLTAPYLIQMLSSTTGGVSGFTI